MRRNNNWWECREATMTIGRNESPTGDGRRQVYVMLHGVWTNTGESGKMQKTFTEANNE
ncbi:MAG: hypothetical protein ABJC05_06305 [Pyrinomonadaceae bacterium]